MKIHHCLELLFYILFVFASGILSAQTDPFRPDSGKPVVPEGMVLAWNEEFNYTGVPDPAVWRFEEGFVRNNELQWYTSKNAVCGNGVLLIEGRREKLKNQGYVIGSTDWRKNREYADFTSSSIQTRGKKQSQFGRFEIRARIDTVLGSWPAIWTLGTTKQWPNNGEIDIMEFYRVGVTPSLLANAAWGSNERWKAKWDDVKIPLSGFTSADRDWVRKFHLWRMDWDENEIRLYLDDTLMNTISLAETINPDGFNPMHQPHYILLNLAIGGNGGIPRETTSVIRYEVDYVRIYQKVQEK